MNLDADEVARCSLRRSSSRVTPIPAWKPSRSSNNNPIALQLHCTPAKDQPPTVAGFNLRGATPEIPFSKTDVTFKQPPPASPRRTHTYSLPSVDVILGLVVLPLLSQTSCPARGVTHAQYMRRKPGDLCPLVVSDILNHSTSVPDQPGLPEDAGWLWGCCPFLSDVGEVKRLTAFGCLGGVQHLEGGRRRKRSFTHTSIRAFNPQMSVGYDTPTALSCSTGPQPDHKPGLISPTASQANNNM